MTDLIVVASSGKGTIPHIERVIEREKWKNVFVITTNDYKDEFDVQKEVNVVIVDPSMYLKELRDDLVEKLKGRISGLEVGLNLISGSGKEHMALISALIKLGIGFRMIALTKEGVEEV